jgi:hypothetical protein
LQSKTELMTPIYKELKCQYQTFEAKARIKHIVTKPHFYKFKISYLIKTTS